MSSLCVATLLSVILPVGGIMGYVRAKSVPSLMAGSLTGAVMAYLATILWKKPYDKYANLSGAAVCLMLGIIMGARYVRSKKFIPLIVSLLSSVSFVIFGFNSV